jgi:hypothetical protein
MSDRNVVSYQLLDREQDFQDIRDTSYLRSCRGRVSFVKIDFVSVNNILTYFPVIFLLSSATKIST